MGQTYVNSVLLQIPVYMVVATDLGMRGARVVAARWLSDTKTHAASRVPSTVSTDATLVFGLGLGLLTGVVLARVLRNFKLL